MKRKLVLNIDSEILNGAKEYAKLHDSSLSYLVENYLKLVTKDFREKSKHNESPIVTLLRGSFKSPQNFDYKSELYKSLLKKHM